MLIDASGSGEVIDEVLRDRRHLAEDGVVVPVVAINSQTGTVERDPDVVSRGLVQDAVFTRGVDDLRTIAVWVVRSIGIAAADHDGAMTLWWENYPIRERGG